jgi:hypothetical protein
MTLLAIAVNDKFGGMENEVVTACFKVLSLHFLNGPNANTETQAKNRTCGFPNRKQVNLVATRRRI